MRLLLFLGIFISIESFGQNCEPNADASVKFGIYRAKTINDTSIQCNECPRRMFITTDSNYAILSFRLVAGGEGFDDVMETFNEGPVLNKTANYILTMIRPGSFIEISCVTARNKKGAVYILQPLYHELK